MSSRGVIARSLVLTALPDVSNSAIPRNVLALASCGGMAALFSGGRRPVVPNTGLQIGGTLASLGTIVLSR